MAKRKNKYEYLAIHEALAFSTKNWDEFRGFLTRNKPYKRMRIIKAMGKFEGGAVLIGKAFNQEPFN